MLPGLPTVTIRHVQYGAQVSSATGDPSWPITSDANVSSVIQEPWKSSRTMPYPEGITASEARLFHVPNTRVRSARDEGVHRADEIVWDSKVWRVSEALHGVAMPGIAERTSAYCTRVRTGDQPAAGVTP
jgi:hypothetical protein